MGLFDSMREQVTGALSGAQTGHEGWMMAVGGLFGDQEIGGLSGLIQRFEANGLGETVSSWVGTGQNLPISAEQIEAVLGSDKIRAYADKLGIPTQDAAAHLADVLPQLVDKVTPSGQVPEGGGDIASALGGFFKGQ
jgi:uncharacterized protein YidB (DUF937 family)